MCWKILHAEEEFLNVEPATEKALLPFSELVLGNFTMKEQILLQYLGDLS